ncbi:MAG: transporter substrate-binding domain-containing protein [Acidobacteria bacterium]|nr:transporter substrate-binding domain-containing protein [Acidobacteriota bacterium]
MKSDYMYSMGVVYNTFPMPPRDVDFSSPDPLTHAVLDARAAHPGATLADLYDPDLMLVGLRRAHQAARPCGGPPLPAPQVRFGAETGRAPLRAVRADACAAGRGDQGEAAPPPPPDSRGLGSAAATGVYRAVTYSFGGLILRLRSACPGVGVLEPRSERLASVRLKGRRPAGVAAVTLLLLVGCRAIESDATSPGALTATTDDWPAIHERGIIRFARLGDEEFTTLPSQGLPEESYLHLARQFAERHGLGVKWTVLPTIEALFTALEAGHADVATATLTVTEPRRTRVAFTVPLTISREWVIGRSEGSFGVIPGSAYEDSLATHYPDAHRATVPVHADHQNIQELIEAGAFEATIMDEAAARVAVRTSPTIRKLRELPEVRQLAWAVRPENPDLRFALDRFLTERHTVYDGGAGPRDWSAIRASGHLRMLTLSSPSTYYLWRGEQLGFQYELVRMFANAHGLDLSVVVAGDHTALLEELLAGRGDLVAAEWVATAKRSDRGVLFTRPYLETSETFVSAREPIRTPADLAGRTVIVPRGAGYATALSGLERTFIVEESDLSSERILEGVAGGALDVTLIERHRAQLEAGFDPRLVLGFALDPPVPLVWAVGPEGQELKRHLDAFLDAGYRGREFNLLYNKYFADRGGAQDQREHRVTGRQLSQFDGLVRSIAEPAGFDWRLIVAQMYQESGFDPGVVSFAGAVGPMQVLPRTAVDLGVDPTQLTNPRVGIEAGVRYLAWSRERFANLPPGEQLWFALAAYNAGYGHVRDARRLARLLGLDPSTWFGHVEEAMLKLSEPRYSSRSAFGYVRGAEVKKYVSEIRDRYRAYVRHYRRLDADDR